MSSLLRGRKITEGVRALVHLTVLHSNVAGAPKGQALTTVSAGIYT